MNGALEKQKLEYVLNANLHIGIRKRIKSKIIEEKDFCKIEICNIRKEIIAYALIDKEDSVKCSKYRFYLSPSWKCSYVTTALNKKRYGLQHIILEISPSRHLQIDHINRNPLDNRKCNLRVCTISENKRNADVQSNSLSGYKGVQYLKDRNKWRARISINRKVVQIGVFLNKEDAIKAYDKKCKEIHKEFALTNEDIYENYINRRLAFGR